MTAMTPGLDVRNVTDVDRRTARRLGMDADKVNLVINTWASEYLNYEMEQGKLRAAANPAEAAKAAAKPARKRTPAKATSAPRKAAKAAADTPTPPVETQSPTEADVAATAEGSPS